MSTTSHGVCDSGWLRRHPATGGQREVPAAASGRPRSEECRLELALGGGRGGWAMRGPNRGDLAWTGCRPARKPQSRGEHGQPDPGGRGGSHPATARKERLRRPRTHSCAVVTRQRAPADPTEFGRREGLRPWPSQPRIPPAAQDPSPRLSQRPQAAHTPGLAAPSWPPPAPRLLLSLLPPPRHTQGPAAMPGPPGPSGMISTSQAPCPAHTGQAPSAMSGDSHRIWN